MCLLLGREGVAQTIPSCRDDFSDRDEYSRQTLHSQQVSLIRLLLEALCRVGSIDPARS
jgi:hypothetical protein